MFPIEVTDLVPDISLLPPHIVKLRGWPKTVRLRKGASKKQPRRCGNCGEMTSHNARSCRAQPCDTIATVVERARIIEEAQRELE
jgi:hypothetical protein